MKKLPVILATVFAILSFSSKAQYITIPDEALRNNILQNHPSCMNALQQLDTTSSEIINCGYFSSYEPISSWQGFQYFRNLHTLIISDDVALYPVIPGTVQNLTIAGNYLTDANFPVLPAGLKKLDVQSYNLNSLPPLPAGLTHLRCFGSNITVLPALPAGLTSLIVEQNYLHALPSPLPTGLDTLNCADNQMTSYQFSSLPPGLKYLDCSGNGYISSLGSSLPSTLKYLDCSGNETLTAIPAFTSQLEFFHAVNCGFTSLPALPSSIRDLDVSSNHLTSLPALPASLQIFKCEYNQLTTMPALPQGLGVFYCGYNHLTSFTDPAFPPNLSGIFCNDNQLTSLPAIPNNGMMGIDCQNNQLTSLPTLPSNLRWLYCQNNQLSSLPVLPSLLESLFCNDNHLTSLPALPAALVQMLCNNNNIPCLPILPAGLQEVWIDNTITCVPNMPPYCHFQGYTYAALIQICNPTNNVNHCQQYPTMTGYIYYDNNNNLVRDNNEPYASEIKLQLSDGTITFTNDSGRYSIAAPALGNYTLTHNSTSYYNSLPTQYNYSFSSYDTIVSNNFGMQATAPFDSLNIFITPFRPNARPGFPFSYFIEYSNPGTTTVSPNVVFNYDNTRLIYDSSSNPAVINTGTSLQLAQPSMVPGDQNNFTAYFHVNAATPLGDTVFVNAHATANAFDGSHSIYNVVRGSYDPNDKSATPVLYPAQVSAGVFIDYSIRFQNCGTDTAFSIVIADTLNGQLEALSLQVTNSSHLLTNIMLKDGIIYFEFDNIQLPDSNVNELKSHGFVNFRIKPKSTVGINDEIPNKAWIYFDFNSPVETNTAITKILDPTGPVPLKLISFNVVRQSKNSANVYWSTSNEINLQKFFIETGFDGRNYSSIASQDAKAGAYNDYTKQVTVTDNDIIYFRLKMVDVDGKFSYSPIVTLKTGRAGNAFSFLNNPAKDLLSISLNEEGLKNTVARIINAQGIVVKTVLLQNDRMDIDIRSLAAGTYVLQTVKGSRSFIVRN